MKNLVPGGLRSLLFVVPHSNDELTLEFASTCFNGFDYFTYLGLCTINFLFHFSYESLI